MKKIIFGLFFLLLASGVNAQGKVGFVDTQAIISSLPEFTAAQNSLASFEQSLVTPAIEAKQSELESKYSTFQAEQASMGDARKEVMLKEIQLVEQDFQALLQANQIPQKLQQKQLELFAPVEKRASDLITEVAKENGYTVVFDASQVPLVYADPSANMMPMILQKLGQ